MYDISLSYMMYLPVSHSIPLTIILCSAFCILRSAFCKIPLPLFNFTLRAILLDKSYFSSLILLQVTSNRYP